MPAAIPETTPDDETVATEVVPDVHTPPVDAVLSEVVVLGQSTRLPVMGAGAALTVTVAVAVPAVHT